MSKSTVWTMDARARRFLESTAIKGRERVRVAGRHAWLVYPDGVGRSKLTTAIIEAKLGARGTARNWNTVLKLRALLHGGAESVEGGS